MDYPVVELELLGRHVLNPIMHNLFIRRSFILLLFAWLFLDDQVARTFLKLVDGLKLKVRLFLYFLSSLDCGRLVLVHLWNDLVNRCIVFLALGGVSTMVVAQAHLNLLNNINI